MLARAAVSPRAALAVLATQRISARQLPSIKRSLSLFPWRKPADPTLPVFFPKTAPERTPKDSSWKKTRYAIITLAVYYAMWQIYMSVVLDPLFDWAENEWEALSEKEKEELEAQADKDDAEPLLFLPFPFTTKEIPQPPYKGSDPEWLAFVKVNKDPKMQKTIKSNLAETVRKRAEANPAFAKIMGGKQTKIRKMWLDIIYPPTPPPKHYVSGLIVDYDGLFWGDRSIETVAANQLNSIMYPKAVALACWTFWNVYLQQTKREISKVLGFEPSQPETHWTSTLFDKPPRAIETTLSSPNTSDKAPQPGSPHGPPDFAGLFRKPAEGQVTLSPNLSFALQAAALTLAKNWKHAEQAVTRGCIKVDGLVEVQGKAAVMVVYVIGWYDPRVKKFMNIHTQLKHLIQLKQRPMG